MPDRRAAFWQSEAESAKQGSRYGLALVLSSKRFCRGKSLTPWSDKSRMVRKPGANHDVVKIVALFRRERRMSGSVGGIALSP